MAIRMRRGFTLVEMLVVIAIIAILAAALFPAIQTAIDQARATAMKNKGRGIWLAISSANMEREPLERGPLWPVEIRRQPADGGEGLLPAAATATDYFNKLIEGATPEMRLVSDLTQEMLSASGFPTATNVLANANIAWRVVNISDMHSAGEAFLISKDIMADGSEITRSNTDTVEINARGPFRGRRILWVTRGGGLFDARRRYLPTWGDLMKVTNRYTILGT